MPLALIVLGTLAALTALKGNYDKVGEAFQKDVIEGFLPMGLGLVGLGVVFSVIGAPNAGRVFISLVLIAYFLTNSTAIKAIEEQVSSLSSTSTATEGNANADPVK
jgi:Flp pilus assembly pilin Flp